MGDCIELLTLMERRLTWLHDVMTLALCRSVVCLSVIRIVCISSCDDALSQ